MNFFPPQIRGARVIFIFSLSLSLAVLIAKSALANTDTFESSGSTSVDWSSSACPPLSMRTGERIERGEVFVDELVFSACVGGIKKAYFVGPSKTREGQQPAILFVHWYEPAAHNSNATEFLAEAKALAKQGVMSLLVSTFWSIPAGNYKERRWQDDYLNSLNQTRDLLRAMAWLRARPEVDKQRVAYVGHDYGAAFGALVAGLDHQIKGFVLVAGGPKLSHWYLYGSASGVPEGENLGAFKRSFSPIEPEKMIASAQAKLLFQFAEQDHYISLEEAQSFVKHAPSDAEIQFYPTGHAMDLSTVYFDRKRWLNNLLQLSD